MRSSLHVELTTMVYSFDIFDTLITRSCGTPAGVFNVMQKEIVKRGIPLASAQIRDFRTIRVYSEREAFLDKRPIEITLDEIYTKVGESLQVPESVLEQLKALEVECEIQSIIPVRENLEAFFDAVNKGQRVILASDMYLPRFAVKGVLDRVDPAIYGASKLYLSSEVGDTKRSGRLYRRIAEQEGVEFSEIFHRGDNENSDYLIPKGLGIKAKHVEFARLRKWETLGVMAHVNSCAAIGGVEPRNRISEILPAHYPELASNTLTSWEVTSGLSRKARLSGACGNYLLGHSVAAPLLVPFAYWVLTEASKRDITRLYFVARDGQIFFKIAKQLQQRGIGCHIDLRYLYGSRRAWHLPSFRGFDDRDLFWIIDSRHGLTLRKLAARLGLSPNELLEALEDDPRDISLVKPLDSVLTSLEIERLPEIFRSNSGLNARVAEVAAGAQERLLEYLDQEGWNDYGIRHALVDIGWSGRSQDSLYRALECEHSDQSLVGFYFGLHRHSDMSNDRNIKLAFALHPHHFNLSPAGRQFLYVIHVMECLTAADHGGTIAYEHQNGSVMPKLDTQGEAVIKWGLERYQQGILDFVREITIGEEFLDAEGVRIRLRDMRHYMFAEYPEKEIADSLGSFPFTPEMDGTGQAEFAPRLSLARSLRYLTIAPKRRSSISSWINGSFVRSNTACKVALSRPSRMLFSVLFHPLHTFSIGIRRLAGFVPKSARPRIRNLIPSKYFDKIEPLVTGRRPTKRS